MQLYQLNLQNFKNYREEYISFPGRITSLVGSNGAGKTNVLDAVHYLAFCKSYLNAVDAFSIRHNSDHFSVTGKIRYDNDRSADTVSCHVRRGQRKVFKMNGKELNRLADHIGNVPAVMMSPYDTVLIDGGSEERRRYLDMIISQFDKVYLDDLISYNRALVQRNALLKQMDRDIPYDPSLLSIWDEQIVTFGTRIYQKRAAFIESFAPLFEKIYQHISGDNELAGLMYMSHYQEENTQPMDILIRSLVKDRSARHTTTGVHRDDLCFMLAQVPVKRFGSQGQQKSFIIALKLAQFEYLQNMLNISPLLLLDDIFDKLDRERIERLMELVCDNHLGQILITDTNAQRIETIFNAVTADTDILRISDGKLIR
jgi:DNA replication and repair protein RecF